LRRYTPMITMLGVGTTQITTGDIASLYIADAEGVINLYLSAKYQTPLAPDPAITDLCSDIAIYRCLADKLPRMPDFMITRYTNATSILCMIRDGVMNLSTGSGQQIVNSGGDEFAWSQDIDFGGGPIFDRAKKCNPLNGSGSFMDGEADCYPIGGCNSFG
jgi:phage gp36-like protein